MNIELRDRLICIYLIGERNRLEIMNSHFNSLEKDKKIIKKLVTRKKIANDKLFIETILHVMLHFV